MVGKRETFILNVPKTFWKLQLSISIRHIEEEALMVQNIQFRRHFVKERKIIVNNKDQIMFIIHIHFPQAWYN